jgi:hypothetical protein
VVVVAVRCRKTEWSIHKRSIAAVGARGIRLLTVSYPCGKERPTRQSVAINQKCLRQECRARPMTLVARLRCTRWQN